MIAQWFWPVVASAVVLGFYDIAKKHAVRDNSVMPVLFWATVFGTGFFVAGTLLFGPSGAAVVTNWRYFGLVWCKSLLVASSWICVYYAMRDLPISIASPIRASSPLWTLIGGIVLFGEIPSWLQGTAMLLIFAGYYGFSVLGRLEGLNFIRHRGIHLIFLGTVLGAASALYDKYLLNQVGIPRHFLQFYFSADMVVILGLAWLVRRFGFGHRHQFQWRWSIPATGILLIAADYLYFYALEMPEIRISVISLVRRCSCVVTFVFGVWYFHDRNIRNKALALALILLGVALLALG